MGLIINQYPIHTQDNLITQIYFTSIIFIFAVQILLHKGVWKQQVEVAEQFSEWHLSKSLKALLLTQDLLSSQVFTIL